MLDGILGRGFASKCKYLIKQTKSRIDVIRNKRNATEKFLKKDIADLLANGLDINAYGRTEGLMTELTHTSCYGFIYRCCDIVLAHLSVMQKQSECPDECKEAVSSLMFAAARFPKLPELRDLKDAFKEKYGNILECSVNQGFVDNVDSKPSTLEKKVLLMQDIATEYSVKWDSNAFQKRMSSSHLSTQDQHKHYEFSHVDRRSTKVKDDISTEVGVEDIISVNRLHSGRQNNILARNNDPKFQFKQKFPSNKNEPQMGGDASILKGNEFEMPFGGQRREFAAEKHEKLNVNEEAFLDIAGVGHLLHRKKKESVDYMDYISSNRDGQYTLPLVKPDTQLREQKLIKNEDAGMKVHRVGVLSYLEKKESNHGILEQPEFGINSISDRDGRSTYSKPDMSNSSAHADFNVNGDSSLNTNKSHAYQMEKMKFVDGGATLHDCRENKASNGDIFLGNNKFLQTNVTATGNVRGDDTHKVKPYWGKNLPPPYVKQNSKPKDGKCETILGGLESGFTDNLQPELPSAHNTAASRKMSGKIDVLESDLQYPDDGGGPHFPKPRSSRRRHLKSQPSHKNVGDVEETEIVKRRPRSGRKDSSKQGLQILFDGEKGVKDEEEMMIDKLLMHYSKKPLPNDHPGKVRRRMKTSGAHEQNIDADKSPSNIGRDDVGDEMSKFVPPFRSISLPREQTATSTSEEAKVFCRAASFAPDRSNANKHVHPKLPDYDDLAARFASLKGS